LHEEFENDVKMIKCEYDREREDIEKSHHLETRELKEMQDAHDGLREETKNKNVEELESMKHELIKQIEKLDKEFEVHFNKYVTDTETKAGQYRNLLESNKKAAGEIGQYQDNINKYKLENTFWSLKRAQNKRECTERNQALQKELRKL
jgi:formyltetrahydrofolate synthetase